ncbi:hypothetical protein GUJ93_ZPchr0003g17250 [Zizania palustris]|uniref:Paladin n=1 Tax=Zizania palustris TaxID=103762 RepID=A0A8J5V6S9_ZIZPA|nr:hypothetical protein GUJ93_ZPchr0003g17250 [Zizania palustris]
MEGVQQVVAEQVISTRGGSVLGKKTILKSDHFPGCQNKRLQPHIDGAPNYRQAGSLHVHGVAMPTMKGIVNVLNHIGAQKKGKQTQILWHSLREEPVIYINGRPFVLRDVERPFSNLEYTGINRERVEQMEFRLKEDILQEASQYGNKILVTDELPSGQMVDQWESVMSDTVKTTLEVYDELQHQGYLVDYERVPITDEKAPKEGDFDNLVRRISQVDIETEIVFNCQMGRGRTTTGMVIATLVYLNRIGASGIPRTSSIGKVFHSGNDVDDYMPSSEEAILRGDYAVIRSLVRVLEGGVEGKRQVDKVIDKCDSMQNLREAIATYRNSILRQPDEMKREASLSFFVEYLERYYFLICFAVYVHSVYSAQQPTFSEEVSFSDWMRARPELYSILRRLLRRYPMGALGYSSLKPPLAKNVESADGRPNEMHIVAAMRNGEVLGRQTVLKSDHCPGCQNLHLPERVDGAPNFREIPEFPVYGVANPTVDGIRAVIQRISTSKGGRPIMWHNMREEPVVYINGKPFVLREVERPYKNMLEYTGIDRDRVERMEARLKEDILREAEHYSGAIMVIHETVNGEIFDAWENVNNEAVLTPLEVYKLLVSEGLPIKYSRVPITDGKAPKSSDFDTIALNVAAACKDTAFVFNCQMGRGRTTTGTVIACLLRLRIDHGRPIRLPTYENNHEDPDELGYSSGEETTDHNGHLNLSSPRPHTVTEHPRFGIDDILVLRKITRLFNNGIECRQILDNVIDKCSSLQNIRQAVLQYTKVINHQHVEQRVKRVALNRGAEYLERYMKLVAFSAYLWSEAFDGFCGQGEAKMSFKAWIHQRPEIQSMKWSIRLRPGRFFTVNDESKAFYQSPQGDVMMEAIVKARNGSVPGKGSILKMYFFPGQKRSSSIKFSGAPHVFKVDGYPVYSMATPTVDGAKEVLSYLGSKDTGRSTAQKVVVTDLREEVVVYIKGTPFVLRELDQPFDTLKHVGISGPMVENIEARLKEDILSEVKQHGDQLLLHQEESNSSTSQCSVVGYWKQVGLDDVMTPAEVYCALRDQGYCIEYKRIPLTREREALAADVDAVQSSIDETARYYLFISHTGYGGVAYAMAITCLGLGADEKFVMEQTAETHFVSTSLSKSVSTKTSSEIALRQGDYRDILNLTRVLVHGPKCKEDVDAVIDRCVGAGHLREDIMHYRKALQDCSHDDETRSYLMDIGTKALRRYFFLITFRSFLFCTSLRESTFASWMEARPELGHLCDNLKLDK